MRSRVIPWMVSPGCRMYGSVERADLRHRPVVGGLVEIDHRRPPSIDPDLVAEVKVDRRRPDLVGRERVDDEPPARDFPQDHVVGEDQRSASLAAHCTGACRGRRADLADRPDATFAALIGPITQCDANLMKLDRKASGL